MPDIIQLLPDHIANQIAAGEVIQRPASAVKELLENAVDAGATEIRLLVNDAGKQLIQVIDNGCGMSETDARMAFERHATSKIRQIEDLFRIRTMGFRGEALASIAAVAQVEIKTKRAEDTAGCLIEIENSTVRRQEPVATPNGTSIAMKNLFFNVPARRNFLKSNAAEMRHIVDEFIRVSMAYPELYFSLSANGQQLFHLDKGTLKQRIVQVLGNPYNARLVAVNEHTDYLNIYGFIGKPETAKKTRGDQYFFVNKRFIKSPYLNHAVTSAFQELIPADSFPAYVLFIDLDPAQVDINVHPTKQEIKFEDEKIVYAFVQAAVKHALAQFSITPTLDFDLDPGIQQLDAVRQPFTDAKKAEAAASGLYQTFTQSNVAHKIDPEDKGALKHWREFYSAGTGNEPSAAPIPGPTPSHQRQPLPDQELTQLHYTYILAATANGLLLIHQQNAHERVLYERYNTAMEGRAMTTQRSLFPASLHLSPQDSLLLTELLDDLQQLGYLIEPFGKDSFVIQGTPADVEQGNESRAIELLLEQFKHYTSELKYSRREKLVRSLARQHSIKAGKPLSKREMQQLVDDLFACQQPNATSNGLPTYTELKQEDLERLFGR
ncbi:MAG TPA: DNA mismatch repair endonuclease MutL [Lacibacter sp.]|nr:DNA mismatch repair endonuclease MutL [Lacibacter sp.]HMO88619.1 DNA mismatch repair endonuclease MutL [Lacibacter sp.]